MPAKMSIYFPPDWLLLATCLCVNPSTWPQSRPAPVHRLTGLLATLRCTVLPTVSHKGSIYRFGAALADTWPNTSVQVPPFCISTVCRTWMRDGFIILESDNGAVGEGCLADLFCVCTHTYTNWALFKYGQSVLNMK